MTKENKAYKFRLYPTEDQAHLMRKTFGCVRFIYNRMLAERKETYEKHKDDKEQLKKQKAYKSASSRLIKRDFPQVKKKLWKDMFWSRSFCLLTTGASPIDVVKTYIEKQSEK
ncbi:transposase, IS605 OrfB family protein [Bacillus thuringiensis Sbt003]|uniref:Transposase, IS605 OrfB family protein n=1 Tax=Bacillus thuringiensis Sbt003 TaxID=1235825 RepID=A0A9X0F725_BACTU|nr:transposase, IS605 OrfB family protein [Bacillus thuringiensis Sbt003]